MSLERSYVQCPHLSHLDRAAGLRCSCNETYTITPRQRRMPRRGHTLPMRSALRGAWRLFGPTLIVVASVVALILFIRAVGA